MVGRNGLGKTTLLRMISEKQLIIPSHVTVLHVEQEVGGGVYYINTEQQQIKGIESNEH